MGGSNRRIGKEKAFLKIENKTILEIMLEKLNQIRKKGDRIIIAGNNISSLQRRLSKFFSSRKETISFDSRESIPSTPVEQRDLTTKSPSKISPIMGKKKFSSQHGIVDVVSDLIPGAGPLGGIYSGLMVSSTEYNFVFACDMPFLNVNLIQYMLRKKTDYDVLIPKYGDCLEPLHGVYSKSIIPVIKEKIEQGNYRIQSILPLTSILSPKGRGNKDGISNGVNLEPSNGVKVKYITEKEMEKFGNWREFFFNINTLSELKKARKIFKQNFRERGKSSSANGPRDAHFR